MEPMVLAKLVQALEVGPDDKVLEVGTGTGYSAALLARLAKMVIALEEDKELAARAQALLAEFATGNSKVVVGPLAAGWPAEAPYDVILINGSVEAIPEALLRQLKEGGRLGTVVRSGAASRITIRTRVGDLFPAMGVFDAAVPPLPGFEAPRGFVF
jgi:protein-L-isoaspartate(D-aspartate) O-methyltransferase